MRRARRSGCSGATICPARTASRFSPPSSKRISGIPCQFIVSGETSRARFGDAACHLPPWPRRPLTNITQHARRHRDRGRSLARIYEGGETRLTVEDFGAARASDPTSRVCRDGSGYGLTGTAVEPGRAAGGKLTSLMTMTGFRVELKKCRSWSETNERRRTTGHHDRVLNS